MIPVIELFGVEISPYWLMLTIGTVSMHVCIWKRKARFSLNALQCVAITILLTAVGVAGAKILFILENIQHVKRYGVSLAGGVSFFGSVYLIPLLMPFLGLLFRLKPSQTTDICAPCVAIMIGCMRFGCFMQGCCGGWLARIGEFFFFWPTQAVESIGDFLIMIWLLEIEKKQKFHGQLYPLFMMSYSGMRFLIEFFRDTPKNWLCLSHGQWFSAAAILIGVLWISLLKRKYQNGNVA